MHITTWNKNLSWKLRAQKDRRVKISRKQQYYKYYYGITLEEYNRLFLLQKGCCAICKKHQTYLKIKLSVDHCHETHKVRGLLCTNCNLGIGLFKNNVKFLKAAVSYLKCLQEPLGSPYSDLNKKEVVG